MPTSAELQAAAAAAAQYTQTAEQAAMLNAAWKNDQLPHLSYYGAGSGITQEQAADAAYEEAKRQAAFSQPRSDVRELSGEAARISAEYNASRNRVVTGGGVSYQGNVSYRNPYPEDSAAGIAWEVAATGGATDYEMNRIAEAEVIQAGGDPGFIRYATDVYVERPQFEREVLTTRTGQQFVNEEWHGVPIRLNLTKAEMAAGGGINEQNFGKYLRYDDTTRLLNRIESGKVAFGIDTGVHKERGDFGGPWLEGGTYGGWRSGGGRLVGSKTVASSGIESQRELQKPFISESKPAETETIFAKFGSWIAGAESTVRESIGFNRLPTPTKEQIKKTAPFLASFGQVPVAMALSTPFVSEYASEYIKGEISGFQRKPVQTAVSFGAGIAIGGTFKGIESGVAAGRAAAAEQIISKGGTWRAADIFSGKVMNYGPKVLGGLYAADVGIRTTNMGTDFSPKAAERFGEITATEVRPMTGGAVLGYKGAGVAIEAAPRLKTVMAGESGAMQEVMRPSVLDTIRSNAPTLTQIKGKFVEWRTPETAMAGPSASERFIKPSLRTPETRGYYKGVGSRPNPALAENKANTVFYRERLQHVGPKSTSMSKEMYKIMAPQADATMTLSMTGLGGEEHIGGFLVEQAPSMGMRDVIRGKPTKVSEIMAKYEMIREQKPTPIYGDITTQGKGNAALASRVESIQSPQIQTQMPAIDQRSLSPQRQGFYRYSGSRVSETFDTEYVPRGKLPAGMKRPIPPELEQTRMLKVDSESRLLFVPMQMQGMAQLQVPIQDMMFGQGLVQRAKQEQVSMQIPVLDPSSAFGSRNRYRNEIEYRQPQDLNYVPRQKFDVPQEQATSLRTPQIQIETPLTVPPETPMRTPFTPTKTPKTPEPPYKPRIQENPPGTPFPPPDVPKVPGWGLPGGGGGYGRSGNLGIITWRRNNLIADQPYLARGIAEKDFGFADDRQGFDFEGTFGSRKSKRRKNPFGF